MRKKKLCVSRPELCMHCKCCSPAPVLKFPMLRLNLVAYNSSTPAYKHTNEIPATRWSSAQRCKGKIESNTITQECQESARWAPPIRRAQQCRHPPCGHGARRWPWRHGAGRTAPPRDAAAFQPLRRSRAAAARQVPIGCLTNAPLCRQRQPQVRLGAGGRGPCRVAARSAGEPWSPLSRSAPPLPAGWRGGMRAGSKACLRVC